MCSRVCVIITWNSRCDDAVSAEEAAAARSFTLLCFLSVMGEPPCERRMEKESKMID